MKQTMTFLVMMTFFMGLTVAAYAHTSKPLKNKVPVARKRQHEQQQRIGQGVRSGELTAGETVRLEKEQREIRQDIRASNADGNVTGAERRDIQQDQNQASRHIYRAKHNRRDRN